jgi:uncharacterized protein (TIGR03067 family)
MPTDLDTLQGTWKVTSLETDGQRASEIVLESATIVIKGNRFKSLGMGARYEGTVELNSQSKPKAFDLWFTSGHAKGHRNLGIYKLAGDKWTICVATRGNKRPTKFATAAGTGLALETLERSAAPSKATKASLAKNVRSTKDVVPQPAAAKAGQPTELEGEWEMAAAVFNGAAMDPSMVQWCRRVTRGNVTQVLAGPQVMVNASFTIDRSTKPPSIDYVNLAGASKGKNQAGVYELSGKDLKICVAAPGRSRPGDFSSKAGDGRSYTTWRLLKK